MPKKESVTIGEFTHFKPLLKIMNTSQTKNEDNLKQKTSSNMKRTSTMNMICIIKTTLKWKYPNVKDYLIEWFTSKMKKNSGLKIEGVLESYENIKNEDDSKKENEENL